LFIICIYVCINMCIYLLKWPIKIAGYGMNGPKFQLDLMTQ